MTQTPPPCPDPSALCRVGRELGMDLGQRAPGARLGGKLQCNETDCPTLSPRPAPIQAIYGLSTPTQPTCHLPGQGEVESRSTGRDKGFQRIKTFPDFVSPLEEASPLAGASGGATRGAGLSLPQRDNIHYVCNLYPSLPNSPHRPCGIGSEQ